MEMEKKKLIQFKNIVKDFDGQLVLKGINLDIYENEFVTLLLCWNKSLEKEGSKWS